MSEPVTAMEVVPVLFAVLPSLVAPVVPLTVLVATAVGVPYTVHVIEAPAATAAGGDGTHDVVRPAGKPLTAHDAAVAPSAGAAAFEHVKVPL